MSRELTCKKAIENAINKNSNFYYNECGSMETFKKVFNKYFGNKYTYLIGNVGIGNKRTKWHTAGFVVINKK